MINCVTAVPARIIYMIDSIVPDWYFDWRITHFTLTCLRYWLCSHFTWLPV